MILTKPPHGKGRGDRKNIKNVYSTGIFSKSTATIETERKRKKIHILESICVGAVLARGHHYSKVVSKCQCVTVGVRMGG